MNIEILDLKSENGKIVYLCKISLLHYLQCLGDDYASYEIQRGIVKNVYLDRIIDTVLSKGHIPILTLVTSDVVKINAQKGQISRFEILDGLQRTFRLKSLLETYELCKEIIEDGQIKSISEINKYQISKKYSSTIKARSVNMQNLLRFLEFITINSCDDLLSCFSENYQWFEIWTNLSSDECVKKMLTLNAGHKSVSLKHQLELLFLNLLQQIRNVNPDIIIARDKDRYSKKRERYHFDFYSIIAAIVSYKMGKAIAVDQSTIANNMDKTFANDVENNDEYDISWDFICEFVNFLKAIDDIIYSKYGDMGLQWFGRDTVLVGFFGAMGKIAISRYNGNMDIFKLAKDKIVANPSSLNLEEYNDLRNNLDLSQINVGNTMRNITYNGILAYLQDISSNVEWGKALITGGDF